MSSTLLENLTGSLTVVVEQPRFLQKRVGVGRLWDKRHRRLGRFELGIVGRDPQAVTNPSKTFFEVTMFKQQG